MFVKTLIFALLAGALAFSSVGAVTLPENVVLWRLGSAPNEYWKKFDTAMNAAMQRDSSQSLPGEARQAYYNHLFGSALSGQRPSQTITGAHWNAWYQTYLAQMQAEVRRG
ncbi:uncharacterized protein SRS1_21038 [Sporisorium reilianum f. sp. reilianum]|uniref:Uncharacterized protein n=1 Tax=Sporisorium reilianum f. sp. reilianum TaxID=72559 RepID=A0A2N8UMI7_9BASI|nr:uncharacterized protein SRS1_21038 [Sporisorium reilianum f. sp. reilianum]